MVFFGPAAGAALLPAVRFLVHGRPSAPFRLPFRNAAVFVAFLDVLGLALLLAGVAGFVAAGHGALHGSEIFGQVQKTMAVPIEKPISETIPRSSLGSRNPFSRKVSNRPCTNLR